MATDPIESDRDVGRPRRESGIPVYPIIIIVVVVVAAAIGIIATM